MSELSEEIAALRVFRRKYRKWFYGMMCVSVAIKSIFVFSIMRLVGWL